MGTADDRLFADDYRNGFIRLVEDAGLIQETRIKKQDKNDS